MWHEETLICDILHIKNIDISLDAFEICRCDCYLQHQCDNEPRHIQYIRSFRFMHRERYTFHEILL